MYLTLDTKQDEQMMNYRNVNMKRKDWYKIRFSTNGNIVLAHDIKMLMISKALSRLMIKLNYKDITVRITLFL